MPTDAPTQSYEGRYEALEGPTLDVIVDSLKYRRNRRISVPVRFQLRKDGLKFVHEGQISMVSWGKCGYTNSAIVDLTFDGPGGQLNGWFDTENRKGMFNARS